MFIISCLFFLIILIYYYFIFKENKFIIIPENKASFYTIPKDKGGEKVANLNKKILNLSSQNISETNNNKPEDLVFSIQFYANSDYNNVSEYLKKITNDVETIYSLDDFYIFTLNSDIGTDYFLLYKNFKNRETAKKYCLEYLTQIEQCLIVDSTKF